MDDLTVIKAQIKAARAYAMMIFEQRGRLASVLSEGIGGYDVEFPDPDVMHVYSKIFNHRAPQPAVWRLSFGKTLRWVGVSHPWGVKPADIEVIA